MAKTKTTKKTAPPHPATTTREPVKFQTHLEQEHMLPRQMSEPTALMINPACSSSMLVSAASARMQAIVNGFDAWLCVDGSGTSASLEEVLRPFSHLAEEVEALLLELGRRHAGAAA